MFSSFDNSQVDSNDPTVIGCIPCVNNKLICSIIFDWLSSVLEEFPDDGYPANFMLSFKHWVLAKPSIGLTYTNSCPEVHICEYSVRGISDELFDLDYLVTKVKHVLYRQVSIGHFHPAFNSCHMAMIKSCYYTKPVGRSNHIMYEEVEKKNLESLSSAVHHHGDQCGKEARRATIKLQPSYNS
ncbi:hypothetical protein FA15DRAFT_659264 [Coprinopsis marcescibilis]|uniref:Uncharacterized protein n=1 Tax=Coprinopsis marcescibilis TaxID=230819 RepID=A0A5C3KJU4_COPMA|nr:hypothetical protein FA15DRAFT_659264 [Coprinopsis marcescibilis]